MILCDTSRRTICAPQRSIFAKSSVKSLEISQRSAYQSRCILDIDI